MAEQLDQFPKKEQGRRGLYPWHEWMNGHPWRLSRPADFKTGIRTMQVMAFNRAKMMGGKIKTYSPDVHTLIVQFIPNGQK